ncbi:MAG: isocitrate lyase/phosphoenolpyruvate mutase family protein [Halioglobus sp.]
MKFFVEIPEVWITEFLEDDPQCQGYWISSLTQSWQKGYADNCTLPWTNYVDVVRRLRLHTDKHIMVDVDMMFNEPSVAATIAQELYAVGCNTVVIESKRFPKVNSLTPNSMVLSTPDEFCRLINKVKTSCPKLEVIARVEYLATTKSVETTVAISRRVVDAGADGVVVHWGSDSDTTLLKETLEPLKQQGIRTGIIPTKYLDQVVAGDFEDLADFSILGNICSSFIRHSFSAHSIDYLLNMPCMFEPILDRVGSHEPTGQHNLVVLGAQPAANGQRLLESEDVVKQFTARSADFFSIILVTDEHAQLPVEDSPGIHTVRIKDSIGEVDSLAAARDLLNTEYTTVIYADIEPVALQWLTNAGLTFCNDLYTGVLCIKTEMLITMLLSSDPNETILEMAAKNSIAITTESA